MDCCRKRWGGGSLVGLILIAIGVLWILNNLLVIDFQFREWWPLILIVLGLIHLFNARRIFCFSGWLLIILGGIFLMVTQDMLEWSQIWRFWPVLLILIGIWMIVKRSFGSPAKLSEESDLDAAALFGGVEKRVNSKNFRGGSASAVFGGTKIDLREAKLAEEGAVMDVSCIFGGVEILIPEDWPVDMRSTAILGGFENKTVNEQKSDGKRLLIKADSIFGGIEIKN